MTMMIAMPEAEKKVGTWLVGWLAGRFVGWLAGKQAAKRAGSRRLSSILFVVTYTRLTTTLYTIDRRNF